MGVREKHFSMEPVRSNFPGRGDAMQGGDDAMGVVRSTFPGHGDAMGVREKHFSWRR